MIVVVGAGVWYFNRGKGADANEGEVPVASADSTNAKETPDTATTASQASAGSASAPATPTSAPATSAAATTSGNEGQRSPQSENATSVKTDADNAQTNGANDLNAAIPSSIDEAVQDVLSGKFGNNPERRRLLGKRYKEIQRAVNKMYRQGKVH